MVKITLTLTAVVLCFDFSIAKSQSRYNQDRIVGGNPIDIEDVPWQVSLQRIVGTKYNHYCGGSIISERYIVTAAHCLVVEIEDIRVQTGANELGVGGVMNNVSRTVSHELFRVLDYDIGLIELSELLEFGPGQMPITLPEQDEPLFEGDLVQITGWGRTIEGGTKLPGLLETIMPIFNQKKCKADNIASGKVTERMVCAGTEGGKGSCQGDSGGPVVLNGILVGVTSWGRGCGHPSVPDVYTRVPAFRDWLDRNAI